MPKKLVFLLLFASFLLVIFKFVLVVRQVSCVFPEATARETIATALCPSLEQAFVGQSLFFTDFENNPIWLELSSRQEYSYAYQLAWIKKHTLGNLEIGLTSKLPDYRLVLGESRFIFNQSNRARHDQEFPELLTIELLGVQPEQVLEQGYLDESRHQQFLSLANAIRQQELAIRQVFWFNDQEIQLLLSELTVLIDTQQDFFWQMERLRVILESEEVREQLQRATNLDLRFNLPVLK